MSRCSYIEFLLGNCELAGVPDQFWPTRQPEEISAFCQRLNLDMKQDPGPDGDYLVW